MFSIFFNYTNFQARTVQHTFGTFPNFLVVKALLFISNLGHARKIQRQPEHVERPVSDL